MAQVTKDKMMHIINTLQIKQMKIYCTSELVE